MKTKRSSPPKWADKLLSWVCKDDVLESVQGDLHEIYHKRVDTLGQRQANLLFVQDALSLLRPRLIKKLEGTYQLNQYGVFKNYVKTSARTIRNNILFSSINIVGLAMSMSVGILMIVLLSELNSYDSFHEKKDRIYRVTTSKKPLFQGEPEYFASTSHYIADQIAAQIPSVEQVLTLDRNLTMDLRTLDKAIAVKGYYSTGSFFDVFSFELKKGNSQTALEKPGSIVLTESSAKKLFGDADPLDKVITVEGNPDFKTGIITGVVKDPPVNSHLDFEVLVSMETMENSLIERRRNLKNNPGLYAQSYVYILLKDDASASEVESVMEHIMAGHNARSAPLTLSLQPMNDFVTQDAGFQPGPIFSKHKIDAMLGLTLVVLLSACFNYSNLSLVRALRRSKEISVRKITGATRFQIFMQFMTEAVMLSLIALMIAVGLFFLVKPQYLQLLTLTSGNRPMFLLSISPLQVFYFLLFAGAVGSMAGFFPSLVFSKLNPGTLFRDAGKIRVFSNINARQILTTFQIALSIGLIMCAVMAHKQYTYVLNYNLGYITDNIVNIQVKGDYIEKLENEYTRIGGVINTSRSSVILGTRNTMPADAMSEERIDTAMFSCNYIDNKYLDMHGFELIAGTGFLNPLKEGEPPHSIIVNERFLKALKLGSPQEAIGKSIWYFDDVKLKIQGVVKDFVNMSLDAEAPEPFGFLQGNVNETSILGVKIMDNNFLATMEALEKSYKRFDPVHPFEAGFYDDQIAKTYEDSKTTFTIISFLAILAISISSLGLLGIAVFTMETRMKEISIRKVLGAGTRSLAWLLSRNLLAMIAISATLAIPASIYIIHDVLLSKFLYKTEFGFVETISGLSIVLFIGVLTIGWQVRTAAVQNPADLLRDE